MTWEVDAGDPGFVPPVLVFDLETGREIPKVLAASPSIGKLLIPVPDGRGNLQVDGLGGIRTEVVDRPHRLEYPEGPR